MDAHVVHSGTIVINVGGMVYETREETLERYPTTLLGSRTKRLKHFCAKTNEFFFDRHRESFDSILYFYQSSGRLCRPPNIKLKVFIIECEFFELPEWAILFMKRKEGGFMEDHIFDLINTKKEEQLEQVGEEMSLRNKVWEFFEVPSSSRYSRYFAYFSVFLLAASIAINCLMTCESIRPRVAANHKHDGWELADIGINCYFLVEFVLRSVLCSSKVHFFQRVSVWIDLIALATFIPLVMKHYANDSIILFFTPFQIFRVIRVFRIAKILPGFNITEIIIMNSMTDMKTFIYYFLIWVTFCGSIMYTFEKGEKDTTFTSVLQGIYWAIQTYCTVGYGDIIPDTAVGKLFATIFVLCFIPTMSVPVLSIIVKFTTFYEFFGAISE